MVKARAKDGATTALVISTTTEARDAVNNLAKVIDLVVVPDRAEAATVSLMK